MGNLLIYKKKLYEISDDPRRKEFLDDLFNFMQKRGTPINRLPIMAKSVLDLYELFNLVIARGGLVDVINKKLWQEIIKGLHLPSSITSAAFTLRTQYMKYLYPYECERNNLSSPLELQHAIDGNRREGRRTSYGTYAAAAANCAAAAAAAANCAPEALVPVQRNHQTPNPISLHAQISPLSLVTAVANGQHHMPQAMMNGGVGHAPIPHPSHLQHPQGQNTPEIEARMMEYMRLLNKELTTAGTSPPLMHRQTSSSPPTAPSPRDGALTALEMSRLTLWNMYNNNNLYPGVIHQPLSPRTSHSPMLPVPSPEPQREALDLGLRSSPIGSSPRQGSPSSVRSGTVKRERPDRALTDIASRTSRKRRSTSSEYCPTERRAPPPPVTSTHITINNRGDGRNNESSLVVSMELNGTVYQGVLFSQSDDAAANTSGCSNGNGKPPRNNS